MTLYETILLNTIYLISPIILYLFFVAYHQNIEKKEKNLFFEITLISSFYLCLRFGPEKNLVFLIAHIPLCLTYLKRQTILIPILSFCLIFYLYDVWNISCFFPILECIFYFLFYLFCKKKKTLFLTLFLTFQVIFYVLLFHTKASISLEDLFLFSLVYLFIVALVFYLLRQADKILKYHMSVKELEQEKQIRASLFKITHEIKNPIAVCKGYLDMFDVNNKEHARKYIPILKEEIERTLILLQDFLSFTKITIEPEELDMTLLLEETLHNFNFLFQEKGIILDKEILDKEVYIIGDYNRLSQVCINLLKNSMEALENKENPKITIKMKILKEQVKIAFIDNGVGISSENLKKIQEPFFTTKKKGTGLGVSLSFEIIKAHHGTIIYHSKENVGTKVIITLPRLLNSN